jgi:hypothetical protein
MNYDRVSFYLSSDRFVAFVELKPCGFINDRLKIIDIVGLLNELYLST